MITFLNFLNKTKTIFAENNVENPQFEARLLLSLFYGIKITKLFEYNDKIITDNEEEELNNIIKARLKNKPLSKIFNKKTFWDFDFFVNESVLDPRFDTEVLVEEIIKTYDTKENLKILDLGTGSGCIILSLLKIFINMQGVAVDISEDALRVACKNAYSLRVNDRCDFIKSNWNTDINEKFDIIVSNPPYIPTKTIETLSTMVREFDPILALDGGNNGLNCYEFLAKNLHKNCKNTTKIFLEIGEGQKNDIVAIFQQNGFKFVKSINDYGGICRILVFSLK